MAFLLGKSVVASPLVVVLQKKIRHQPHWKGRIRTKIICDTHDKIA